MCKKGSLSCSTAISRGITWVAECHRLVETITLQIANGCTCLSKQILRWWGENRMRDSALISLSIWLNLWPPNPFEKSKADNKPSMHNKHWIARAWGSKGKVGQKLTFLIYLFFWKTTMPGCRAYKVKSFPFATFAPGCTCRYPRTSLNHWRTWKAESELCQHADVGLYLSCARKQGNSLWLPLGVL